MATVTLVHPVVPAPTVHLELTLQEAATLRRCVGNISGTGKFRRITNEIHRALGMPQIENIPVPFFDRDVSFIHDPQ